MYLPAGFSESNPDQLARLIREESFATLISLHSGELFAGHVPLLLEQDPPADDHALAGRLIGHVARANPQWTTADGSQVLAIFHGPHAYISPIWYGPGPAVPTWNYLVVHVHGLLRVVHESDRLREIVARTVEFYEAGRDPAWTLDAAPPDFLEKLLAGIVGFEIEIQKTVGKFKLSQNQPVSRRIGVIDGLTRIGTDSALDLAAWMREMNPETH